MTLRTETLSIDLSRDRRWALSASRRGLDFLALTKPRMVVMILVTTFVGFYLGSTGVVVDTLRLMHTLLGTGLAAAGTLALNQFLERDVDARMERTRLRPLPDGRLQPTAVLAFGTGLTVAGVLVLVAGVNLLSGVMTGITAGSYLFVYTPLKRRTPLCTLIGEIPGALPPVTGWAAARAGLGLEAGIPRLEHLFHEGTGPKDPGIGQDRLLALADGPDLGPAAQGADEAAPHQLGAAPLGEAFFQVTPVGAAGCWFVLPEPGQDGGTILPGRGLVAE